MLTRALVRARAIGDKAKPMGARSKHRRFAMERGRAVLAAPLLALAQWALPPRCPGCAEPVEADHRFCSQCWGQLRFLDTQGCTCCGMPLGGLTGRCGACLADPPRHAGVHAAVAYGPIARELPIRLKHGGRIGVAETMAGPMARRMPPGADLLIPVPLHRWRLWRRGFNQAVLIGEGVARRSGVPMARQVLQRVRATPLLRGLAPKQRRAAVTAAFRVTDPAAVKGRHVVLVDDVYTTGATAGACVRVLLAAGAASVAILCWARVIEGAGD
ncbi:double zinc ribbon domain-containing protein [Sphingomonas parapaucimobilis]|uniref:double zinc ribbon domain-containing protein n=1 Tax=Sphingomonas parapaucimobilis TaxID=28213 RepID=UPI0035C7AC34